MVFFTEGMELRVIRTIHTGDLNDIVICRDFNSPLEVYYTTMVVKNRECAKLLLAVYENSAKFLPDGVKPYLHCFSQNEELCYLFPYRAERRLAQFAPAQITTAEKWENTCINLVMECLSSPLPYPLLALALEQCNIHLQKDGSVFFSHYFDLEKLNPQADETYCANCLIELMLKIFKTVNGRAKSAELMRKKLLKRAYRSLSELYRDIKVTAIPAQKAKLTARLKGFGQRHKDLLFRLLLTLSVIVLCFAMVIALSQLIFGSVPLLRLFESCFDVIGTRTLSR